MELTSLIDNNKSIEVPFPGMEEFVVAIHYVSKEEIKKIAEKAKTINFDSKTRQPIESLDDELFSSLMVKTAVVGWKGLKIKYLKELVLVKSDIKDEEAEVPYTEDNAVALVNESSVFDNWLTSVVSDISLFNKDS